jgi:hypothetical protein
LGNGNGNSPYVSHANGGGEGGAQGLEVANVTWILLPIELPPKNFKGVFGTGKGQEPGVDGEDETAA